MKMLRITFGVLLLAGAAMSGCAEAAAQVGTEGEDQVVISKSAARKDLAKLLHGAIAKNLTEYNKITRTKALAGCISWDPLDVSLLTWYFTTDWSDGGPYGGVGLGELNRAAIYACDKARKKRNGECKCVRIDSNGRNALKVPSSVPDDLVERHRRFLGNTPGTTQKSAKTPTLRDKPDRELCQSLPYGNPDLTKEAERRELTEEKCKELLGQ